MSRPGTSNVLPRVIAPIIALFALGGCGDATDPPDGPLANLDEMAIYAAMVEELGLFIHTAEANAILRLALGSAIPPAEPYPPELFGHTMVYDVDTDSWTAQAAPEVPDSVLRVTWYEVTGSFVAVPVVERGFIELTERTGPNPELTRLHVRAVRTDNGPTTLADYDARFGETSNATTRSRTFGAGGMVSDGERNLTFDTMNLEDEALGSGDLFTTITLELSSTGFGYQVALDEREQAGEIDVSLDARVTVSGVESRLELTIDEVIGGPVSGTGALFHAGLKIADISVSGSAAIPQWRFSRPDGSLYTGNQEQRVADFFTILLIPLGVSANYFLVP